MTKIMRFDFIMEAEGKKYRITLGLQRVQVYETSLVDREVRRSSFDKAMSDILEHKDGVEVQLNRMTIVGYSVENILARMVRELEDKREEQKFASIQKDMAKRKKLRKEGKLQRKIDEVILADETSEDGSENAEDTAAMPKWLGDLVFRRPELAKPALKKEEFAPNGKKWPPGMKFWTRTTPTSRERFPGWTDDEIKEAGFTIKEESQPPDTQDA